MSMFMYFRIVLKMFVNKSSLWIKTFVCNRTQNGEMWLECQYFVKKSKINRQWRDSNSRAQRVMD